MTLTPSPIGLGAITSTINFCIANRPLIDNYPALNELHSLATGELAHIVKHTSNHWRKVFNVYAKLLFDWHHLKQRNNLPASWQEYRDQELFQSHSQEALLFSAPELTENNQRIHIIAGKTYAATLNLPPLTWLDAYFAVNKYYRVIVAPYPDYRQLSNERIARLIEIMDTIS